MGIITEFINLFKAIFIFLKNCFLFIVDFLNLALQVFLETISFFTSISLDISFLKAFSLDVFFIALWSFFFIYYAVQKTIKLRYLFLILALGSLVAFFSFYIEKLFSSEFFSFTTEGVLVLKNQISGLEYWNIAELFLLSFFFIALIEEGIKFLVLRKFILIKGIDQVVDGMKAGIWLGLGFALVENLVYYINFLVAGDFSLINVIGRGFLSTLAHCLFGALMGYYLVLAKLGDEKIIHFRIVNQGGKQIGFPEDQRQHMGKFGFFVPLVAHGFFNFFLFLNLGTYSILLIAIFLIIIIIWYGKKKNMELFFEQEGAAMIFSPEVATVAEEGIIENEELSEDQKRENLLSISKKDK